MEAQNEIKTVWNNESAKITIQKMLESGKPQKLGVHLIRSTSGYEILDARLYGDGKITLGIDPTHLGSSGDSRMTAYWKIVEKVRELKNASGVGISLRNTLLTRLIEDEKFRNQFFEKLALILPHMKKRKMDDINFDDQKGRSLHVTSPDTTGDSRQGKTMHVSRDNFKNDFRAMHMHAIESQLLPNPTKLKLR